MEHKKRLVYVDNAATTGVSKEVLDAMLPYFTECFGNPSSVYSAGREAKIAIDTARAHVANSIGAQPSEIYFTSCGTESNNWAIRGAAFNQAKKGKKHIITTVFEHHAILHTCQALEEEGFDVTYLEVDKLGLISPEQLEAAIRPDTGIVSIMYANNEIGTIMPIKQLGEICKKHGVLFHTDAVQAIGNVVIDVKDQNIDMLSLTGHKLHAPKGIGVLYIKKGVAIRNLMFGGGQERGKRPGTENTPYIVGLGKALEIATLNLTSSIAHKKALRDRTIDALLKVPYSRLNGDREKRLPGNVNISFEGIEGESMLMFLDMEGICASSGSACTSGSLDPSHVLMSLGLRHEVAHGSVRISYDTINTDEDADLIIEKLPEIVERLRKMSPLWEDMMKAQNKQ